MTTDTQQTSPRGRKLSRSLLLISIVVTVLVAVVGSAILLRLYDAAFASPVHSTGAVFTSEAKPLVVGLGRAPGGPTEWITVVRAFARVQKALARPVDLHYALDYGQQMGLLDSGQGDVALVSVHAYLHAKREGNATLVAAPVIAGDPKDTAVLVVAAGSPIRTLEDLRGKRIALSPDLVSAPFAKWLVREKGGDLSYFGQVIDVSGQDPGLTMVAKGDSDATCARRSSLASWPNRQFRVVAESPVIGPAPIVATRKVDADTVRRVREALTGYEPSAEVRRDNIITGFAVPSDSDYDFARVLEAYDEAARKGAK